MAALIAIATRAALSLPLLGTAHSAPPIPSAVHPSGQASGPLFPMPTAGATTPAEPVLRTPAMVERWRVFIAEASRRFAIPESWIAAVMAAESGGLTEWNGHPITSRRGAMGLMQLMPETWGAMRAELRLGRDPYDPHDNILAGAAYLAAMYQRFGYPGLFAAYNAGPARYAAHLQSGTPLPGETRAYIALLARAPATADMPPAILSGTRLFFTLGSMAELPDGDGGVSRDASRDAPSGTPDDRRDAPFGAAKPSATGPAQPSGHPPVLPRSDGLFVPLQAAPGGQP